MINQMFRDNVQKEKKNILRLIEQCKDKLNSLEFNHFWFITFPSILLSGTVVPLTAYASFDDIKELTIIASVLSAVAAFLQGTGKRLDFDKRKQKLNGKIESYETILLRIKKRIYTEPFSNDEEYKEFMNDILTDIKEIKNKPQ